MGIRRKISLGFFTLAMLLLFSGMISLFELNKLSRKTHDILESSSHTMELSKIMLDALQDQNTSMLQMIVLKTIEYDSLFMAADNKFDHALGEITRSSSNLSDLNSIYGARERYNKLLIEYFDESIYTDIEWFLQLYKTSYLTLTDAIKEYMMSFQHSLTVQAAQLETNAYRAISPSIITLVVAILIVIIFAFLLNLYYIRPILEIKKGLQNYVEHRVPFKVKMEGRDDLYHIKEYIEKLINMVNGS